MPASNNRESQHQSIAVELSLADTFIFRFHWMSLSLTFNLRTSIDRVIVKCLRCPGGALRTSNLREALGSDCPVRRRS
jgi:hypothetical protein